MTKRYQISERASNLIEDPGAVDPESGSMRNIVHAGTG